MLFTFTDWRDPPSTPTGIRDMDVEVKTVRRRLSPGDDDVDER